MHLALHPDASLEAEALADLGFTEERAVGRVFGLIDDYWVGARRLEDAMGYFGALPFADAYLGRAENVRSLDAPDGAVGFIVTVRNGVLLLLAASTGDAAERRAAVGRAIARQVDLGWVDPEEG